MPHSVYRYMGDMPFTNGFLFCNAQMLRADQAVTYVRNAPGDWTMNLPAALTSHVFAPFGENMYRTLQAGAEWKTQTQNQFGGQYGAIPYPGRPPFTWGGSGPAPWLQPPTALPSKGFQVNDIWIVYVVSGAAATSLSVVLTITTFANGIANVVTTVPLSPPAFPTAVQAAPYVVVVPVTTPAMQNTDLSDLNPELTVVAPASCIVKLYGIGCHFSFNYN